MFDNFNTRNNIELSETSWQININIESLQVQPSNMTRLHVINTHQTIEAKTLYTIEPCTSATTNIQDAFEQSFTNNIFK